MTCGADTGVVHEAESADSLGDLSWRRSPLCCDAAQGAYIVRSKGFSILTRPHPRSHGTAIRLPCFTAPLSEAQTMAPSHGSPHLTFVARIPEARATVSPHGTLEGCSSALPSPGPPLPSSALTLGGFNTHRYDPPILRNPWLPTRFAFISQKSYLPLS